MKKLPLMIAIAWGAMAMSAQAQTENTNAPKTETTSAEARMKEMQAQGFGAQNAKNQGSTSGQDSTAKAEGDTDPSFPGGAIFMEAYLKKKLLHSGVTGSGTVVVSFRVDAKGNLYGAAVTQSAGSTLDTAAFNIVTGMPRWKPGLTNGVPTDKPAQVSVVFNNGQ